MKIVEHAERRRDGSSRREKVDGYVDIALDVEKLFFLSELPVVMPRNIYPKSTMNLSRLDAE